MLVDCVVLIVGIGIVEVEVCIVLRLILLLGLSCRELPSICIGLVILAAILLISCLPQSISVLMLHLLIGIVLLLMLSILLTSMIVSIRSVTIEVETTEILDSLPVVNDTV
jgi:hypothetical protein